MENQVAILLHAEFLSNIRQLTLHVSLPLSCSGTNLTDSAITLSESCRAVVVLAKYDDRELLETLKLPVKVNDASRRNLTFKGHHVNKKELDQKPSTADYSFRLQVDPSDVGLADQSIHDDNYVPWNANEMKNCVALHCKFCNQSILNPVERSGDNAWQWKDLPSGNWAEMMDFWHCHKPEVHPDEKQNQKQAELHNASVKGYGASNQVVASQGTGLVDVASFLVAEKDYQGVELLPQEIPVTSNTSLLGWKNARKIKCIGCGSIIGAEDLVAEGFRLYKNNVSVEQSEGICETHSVDVITSSQLLDLIEHEGVRRFVVHAGSSGGILLWAFNPDLRYSSTGSGRPIFSKRAMKILYQHVTDIEEILNLESEKPTPLSVEELFLPLNIYDELVQSLKNSNGLMPSSARVFREWNVALLDRLEKRAS